MKKMSLMESAERKPIATFVVDPKDYKDKWCKDMKKHGFEIKPIVQDGSTVFQKHCKIINNGFGMKQMGRSSLTINIHYFG